MADVPEYEVFSGSIDNDAQLTFVSREQHDLVALYSNVVNFSVSKTATALRVDFDRQVGNKSSTYEPANYTITGPSSITISDVGFTPDTTYLILYYTGEFVQGTYTLTIDPETVQASNDISVFNITTGVDFDGGVSFNCVDFVGPSSHAARPNVL